VKKNEKYYQDQGRVYFCRRYHLYEILVETVTVSQMYMVLGYTVHLKIDHRMLIVVETFHWPNAEVLTTFHQLHVTVAANLKQRHSF